MTSSSPSPDPEDEKLVVLARSARARTGAADGAAVRDLDGRTYVAATVSLPSVRLTALQAAVAAAASSGVAGLEAAAVVTEADVSEVDVAAVTDLGGAGTPVLVARPDGSVAGTVGA